MPDGGLVAVVDGESHPVADVRNERWYQLDISFAERDGFQVRRADQWSSAEHDRSPVDISGPICIGSVSDRSRRTLNARLRGRIRLTSADQTAEWRTERGPVGSISPVRQGSPAIIVHNAPTFAVASPHFTGEVPIPVCARINSMPFICTTMISAASTGRRIDRRYPRGCGRRLCARDRDGSRVERLPFFVRPRRHRSDVAVLPTCATYLAYADRTTAPHRYPQRSGDRAHLFAIDNNFLSLYDTPYSDLSSVGSLTSGRRPARR